MDNANPVTGQQAHPTVPSAPVDTWRGTFMPPAVPPVRPYRPPRDRMWFRQTTLRLLRDPFTRDFWRQFECAALGLLLAIPGFVFIVVAVTVGFSRPVIAAATARRLSRFIMRSFLSSACWPAAKGIVDARTGSC